MNRDERKRRNKEEADRLAQETLDKMKERREARLENFQEKIASLDREKVFKFAIISVTAVLILIGTIFFIVANDKTKKLELEANTLMADIAQKQADIDGLQLSPVEVEYVQETLNTCLQQGNKVAEYQNNYANLLQAYNVSQTDEALQALGKNADDLGTYLTDRKNQTYWYSSDSSNEIYYTWYFETTYAFKGASIPVIWTCYENNTDNLLAYATGIYNVATNKFSNVEYEVTNYGKKFQYGVTEQDNATSTDATSTDATSESSDNTNVATEDNTMIPDRPETDSSGRPLREDAFYSSDLGRYIYKSNGFYYDAITQADVTDGVNGHLKNFHWDDSVNDYTYEEEGRKRKLSDGTLVPEETTESTDNKEGEN